MLTDPHLKVISYESDSNKVFPNTDIKGGVAVTYRDSTKNFGIIDSFTPYEELNSILHRVKNNTSFRSIQDIVVTSFAYHYTDKLHEDFPDAALRLSKGHAYDLKSNAFDKLSDVFRDIKPKDGQDYIRILGRQNNERKLKFIRKDYVNEVENLYKYKIFMPKANGTGAFGEILTLPEISEPGVGGTESFVSIGFFDSLEEARNLLQYIKTKFMRALLGVAKITQDLTPAKWKYVPLQDFSAKSDIDWSGSVADIDRQLYAKYGLSDEEVDFIETHVKEMV